MIKAVMFDMDGLLLDSERIFLEAFLDVGQTFELPNLAGLTDVFKECIGLRSKDSGAILDRHIGPHMDRVAFEGHWSAAIADLLVAGIPAKPGAETLLQGLHAAGIPAGVVTSTRTEHADDYLTQAGLRPYLKHIIGGDQVTKGKPDPEGYKAMAAHLGFAPSECSAFEDSDTGTRAAVASGARVVQVPDIAQPSQQTRALGHHIAPDLLSGARWLGLPV